MGLCMHAASFSSAVLGFWKCLVLVGSFHSLYYLPFGQGKAAGWKAAGVQVFAANWIAGIFFMIINEHTWF